MVCCKSPKCSKLQYKINIMVCCKSPSALNFLEGDRALCRQSSVNSICDRKATDVPLAFPCFALVFFDFHLCSFGVEVISVGPFSFPLVFFNFPLIFLVASFGFNVHYSRKLIFWCVRKSLSAVNYNGKSILWCAVSRQVS